jgi:hypothetical protein
MQEHQFIARQALPADGPEYAEGDRRDVLGEADDGRLYGPPTEGDLWTLYDDANGTHRAAWEETYRSGLVTWLEVVPG